MGHFNNFFPLGGGGGVERYEKTNHQKRECPKVCPGEDVEDGQLKTGEQLRFAISSYTPQGPARSRSEGILYKDIKNSYKA